MFVCDLEMSQDQGHKIKTLTLQFNVIFLWGLEEVLDNLNVFFFVFFLNF